MPYGKLSRTKTPQTQPIPGREASMKENHAGGFVFTIDKWARLERFLILGSDSNSYYQKARDLTRENSQIVNECFSEDPENTIRVIRRISLLGLAPKVDPAIFACALGACHPDEKARQHAYRVCPDVLRTASHLFQWMRYCRELGKGSGRGFKRVLANWYSGKDTDKLAYQMIKYRDRQGYNHKRAIELAGRGAGDDEARKHLYLWARGKEFDKDKLPNQVRAHIQAMENSYILFLPKHIALNKLPWEALPTSALNDPNVWDFMVPTMGLTAIVRHLGKMTSIDAITRKSYNHVVERILNPENIKAARVHPFALLQALCVYKAGRGIKGDLKWNPVGAVVDALETAFYMAFQNVEPTNKRILLALDVSGSMTSPIFNSFLTCREASAAMALVTMATEPNCEIVGFTSKGSRGYGGAAKLTPLDISPKDRLDQAVKKISGLSFGGTDCSLPMRWAQANKKQFDAFILYTDGETWAGPEHPTESLRNYRIATGIPAKSAVIAFTATEFTIADPNDAGQIDFIGFDASAPSVLSSFIGK
jgi:60 kDa SS-A/Ro ribonucleoprotein